MTLVTYIECDRCKARGRPVAAIYRPDGRERPGLPAGWSAVIATMTPTVETVPDNEWHLCGPCAERHRNWMDMGELKAAEAANIAAGERPPQPNSYPFESMGK